MRPQRLLSRLRAGHYNNVAFSDALRLARAAGFRSARTRGSHHLLAHPSVRELLNLQERHGRAKPYQLRQMLELIDRYDLRVEDR